jgi:hypothetical protein
MGQRAYFGQPNACLAIRNVGFRLDAANSAVGIFGRLDADGSGVRAAAHNPRGAVWLARGGLLSRQLSFPLIS